MKPADTSNQAAVTANLVLRGWVCDVVPAEPSPLVLWTPEGAERALLLSRIVSHFKIRTLSDLAAFDRGCKGEAAGFDVGMQVAAFWDRAMADLGLQGDLNGIHDVLKFIATSARR